LITVSYSALRQNLKKYLDQVNDDSEEMVVTRPHGTNVVVIAESEWENIQETMKIYSDPTVLANMRESVRQLEDGETTAYASVEDLEAALRWK
jgi:antitoxin YefM